jgi:hypothetical protein
MLLPSNAESNKLNYWRNEYEKTRGGLQECGTQTAHNILQSVSGSFAGKSEQWLYKRGNELVKHAVGASDNSEV